MKRIRRILAVPLVAAGLLTAGGGDAQAAYSDCGAALCYWAGQNAPGSPNWRYTSTGNSGVNYYTRYNGYSNRKVNRYTGSGQTGTGTCMNAGTGWSLTSPAYVGSHLIFGAGTIC